MRSSDEQHPLGALIVRVWTEGTTEEPLVRARFVGRFDVVVDRGPTGSTPPEYATGLDEIGAKTRDWLVFYLAAIDSP